MNPVNFPQATVTFSSPSDLEGSCESIKGFVREVKTGIFDGSTQVVVAWKPTEKDLEILNKGGFVYLSAMGGLPPHYLSTTFEDAIQ